MPETINYPAQGLAALGQRAHAAFVQAIANGDTDAFHAMMVPDVRFYVSLPFEEWRGEQRGANRVLELIAFERDVMQVRLRFGPARFVQHGATVGAEFAVTGQHRGGPYQNQLALFFDFDPDGRIAAWREYTGDVDPKAVAALAQH